MKIFDSQERLKTRTICHISLPTFKQRDGRHVGCIFLFKAYIPIYFVEIKPK